MVLPDDFAREELQVWLLVENPDGRWSEAVYVESEELDVGSEKLETYSSTNASRRSSSPNVGEELGMQGVRKVAAPPE